MNDQFNTNNQCLYIAPIGAKILCKFFVVVIICFHFAIVKYVHSNVATKLHKVASL